MAPKQTRETMARKFITSKGFGFQYDDLNTEGQNRANRLVSPDSSWSPRNETLDDSEQCRGETSFKREFESFCPKLPEVHARKILSGVFFDASAMDEYLVIRRQRAGICNLHAGVLLQHYLQCQRTRSKNHAMLDISDYIQNHVSHEDVANLLIHGSIGSSVAFFARITGMPENALAPMAFVTKSADEFLFESRFECAWTTFDKRREPAIVSNFLIEKAFLEDDTPVFDYEVKETKFTDYAKSKNRTVAMRHSMILIGVHKDEEGKVWFLLQNFWVGKYVRLVSAEYLASCEGKITFVPKARAVSLSANYKVVNAHYVETFFDAEELDEAEPEEWADLDFETDTGASFLF